MSIFEYLKAPDVILSLFLHKNWTGLILLAPTVYTANLFGSSTRRSKYSHIFDRVRVLKRTFTITIQRSFHLPGPS